MAEIEKLDDPYQKGKPLVGNLKGYWSYRVGDYRIICQVFKTRLVIEVAQVGNRRDIYGALCY